MRLARLLLLLMACGSHKADPPTTGSGSPAPVALDANIDALDEKIAAAIPEAGIQLAIASRGVIVIARLDRAGVKFVTQVSTNGFVSYGWLDPETLIIRDPNGKPEHGVVIKVVEGKPLETFDLDPAWANGEMLVTKGGEAWLQRCTDESDSYVCERYEYLRVLPSKLERSKPTDVIPDRLATRHVVREVPQGTFAAVAGPANVKLEKVKLAKGKLVATKCTMGDTTSTYPDPTTWDASYRYTAKATRWVLEEPAIYEVVAGRENGVRQIETTAEYFEPCSATPLRGFIGLGGPLWGQWEETDTMEGMWTFRVGTTEIGTLDGTELRTNKL